MSKKKKRFHKTAKKVMKLVIAPFLPLIIFFLAIFITISFIADLVYIEFSQSDDYLLKDYLAYEFQIDTNELEPQVSTLLELGDGMYYNNDWLAENLDYNFDIYKNENIIWPLPLENARISSPYGYRVHPITHQYSFHNGIDIPAIENTDVLSVVDGVVVSIFYTSVNGNTIVVRDSKYDYLFLHLSKIDVTAGQEVHKGERIGGVGTTGMSTGNHLHFMITEGSYKNGKHVSPLEVMKGEQP